MEWGEKKMTLISRNFTHISIPAEIWLRKDISMQAKCLWAELRSLHDKERGGCYASDEYLCEFIQLQRRRLYVLLKELKDAGLLESRSDGRRSIRRAIVPEVEYESAQQKCTILHSTSAQYCTSGMHNTAPPSYIYNKEENKEENTYAPSKDDAKKSDVSSLHQSTSKAKSVKKHPPLTENSDTAPKPRKEFVSVSDDQHKKLLEKYGAETTNEAYEHLNDWKESKASTDPKALEKHTDYYRITKWVMKELQQQKTSTAYQKPKSKLSLPGDGKIDSPDAPWRKRTLLNRGT